MVNEIKTKLLNDLKRDLEVIQNNPHYTDDYRNALIQDIQRKMMNIDEYVSCAVSRYATTILDLKSRYTNEELNHILKSYLPNCMITDENITFWNSLSRDICKLKGFTPYDEYHQQLYERFGFTKKLPTLVEIEDLEKQLKACLHECGYGKEYLEILKEIRLKKHELGEDIFNISGKPVEMNQNIVEYFDNLIQESSKAL